MNGGYYGGMQSFNAITGINRWFTSDVTWESYWEPAVNNDYVFIVDEGNLVADSPETGERLFDIRASLSVGTPVLGARNDVIVGGNQLCNYAIDSRSESWCANQAGNFSHPAVGNGKVFTFLNGILHVFNELSGELLWAMATGSTTNSELSNIIVTGSHVIFSDGNNTVFVNQFTQETDWEYPVSGRLSLDDQGALYVVDGDTIHSIRVRP